MFSVKENSVSLDALYLVKCSFGKYFCYFDSNHVAVSLQWGVWETSFSPDGSGDNVPNW